MKSLSFKKSERLHKKREIQELFEKGSSFCLYPFKVIYRRVDSAGGNQVLIAVPKKKHNKAVVRNKLKRRIREAYRINKFILSKKKIHIAYIYNSDEVLNFQKIESSMVKALQKLQIVNID